MEELAITVADINRRIVEAEREYEKTHDELDREYHKMRNKILDTPTGDVIFDYAFKVSPYPEHFEKVIKILSDLENNMVKHRGDYIGVFDFIERSKNFPIYFEQHNLTIGKIIKDGNVIQKNRNGSLSLNLGRKIVRYNSYFEDKTIDYDKHYIPPSIKTIDKDYNFRINIDHGRPEIISGIATVKDLDFSFGKEKIWETLERLKRYHRPLPLGLEQMFEMLEEK